MPEEWKVVVVGRDLLESLKSHLFHCCIRIFGKVCLGISILRSSLGDFYAHCSFRPTAEFSTDSFRISASALLMEATLPQLGEEQGWAEAALPDALPCSVLGNFQSYQCFESSFNWHSCGEGTCHVNGDAQPRAFMCFLKHSYFLAGEEIAGEET